MRITKSLTQMAFAMALFFLEVTPSLAASVVNGGALLSVADANQLSNWVGVSGLILTNVYTSKPGDTTVTWHAAVDNKGPTFTLITARVAGSNGAYDLIGGYNPQAWSAAGSANLTRNDSARTGFIFDLSTVKIERQIVGSSEGQFQTYNDLNYGPTFGWGYDISVYSSNLKLGSLTQYSYSLAGVTSGLNLFGAMGTTALEIGSIETYGFTTVPELPNLVCTAFGLWLLVWMRRRKGQLSLSPHKA